jgi:hypothetical protein
MACQTRAHNHKACRSCVLLHITSSGRWRVKDGQTKLYRPKYCEGRHTVAIYLINYSRCVATGYAGIKICSDITKPSVSDLIRALLVFLAP